MEKETLFLALTRPAIVPYLGVPFEALMLNLMLSFFVGLWGGNPFLWGVFVIIHFPMRVIASIDPNFFRLGRLWLLTKGQSVGSDIWGGSMLSPLPSRLSKHAKDRSSGV